MIWTSITEKQVVRLARDVFRATGGGKYPAAILPSGVIVKNLAIVAEHTSICGCYHMLETLGIIRIGDKEWVCRM